MTGEEWQVHGGGFYHVRKYMVAPPELPEHLTWFKWESYATWVSGFALLCVLYYAHPEFYLVDNEVMELSNEAAIAISVASIGRRLVRLRPDLQEPLRGRQYAADAVPVCRPGRHGLGVLPGLFRAGRVRASGLDHGDRS